MPATRVAALSAQRLLERAQQGIQNRHALTGAEVVLAQPHIDAQPRVTALLRR
jgi:hypothetical protein